MTGASMRGVPTPTHRFTLAERRRIGARAAYHRHHDGRTGQSYDACHHGSRRDVVDRWWSCVGSTTDSAGVERIVFTCVSRAPCWLHVEDDPSWHRRGDGGLHGVGYTRGSRSAWHDEEHPAFACMR